MQPSEADERDTRLAMIFSMSVDGRECLGFAPCSTTFCLSRRAGSHELKITPRAETNGVPGVHVLLDALQVGDADGAELVVAEAEAALAPHDVIVCQGLHLDVAALLLIEPEGRGNGGNENLTTHICKDLNSHIVFLIFL